MARAEGIEARPAYGHLGRAEPLVNPIRDGSGLLLCPASLSEMEVVERRTDDSTVYISQGEGLLPPAM
jgi:hypothetical protein